MHFIAIIGALVWLLAPAYIGLQWCSYYQGDGVNTEKLKEQSLLCACSLVYVAIALYALWALRSFGAYLIIGVCSLVMLLAWHWLLQPSIRVYYATGQWPSWEELGDVPWPLESLTQTGVDFTIRERQVMRWTIAALVIFAWPVSISMGRLAMTIRAMRLP